MVTLSHRISWLKRGSRGSVLFKQQESTCGICMPLPELRTEDGEADSVDLITCWLLGYHFLKVMAGGPSCICGRFLEFSRSFADG